MEQNEFRRFVEMRGGKNRSSLLKMFDLVRKIEQMDEEISREAFFALWQPGAEYDGNNLRKRLAALKKLLDDYLAMVELLRDPLAAASYRMKALENRGWSEFAAFEHRAAVAQLADSPMTTMYFETALEIEENYLSIALKAPRRNKAPLYQQPLDCIDMHFLVHKLRYAYAAINQDRILGTQHDLGLLQEVLQYVAAQESQLPPLVRIYYHFYCLQAEPSSTAHFEALMKVLDALSTRLSPSLLRELYEFAINHCVARLNAGERSYVHEIESIYEKILQNKALRVHGMIDAGGLKNMIAIVLLTGKLDLAEAILQEYGPCLLPEADPACIPYNQALIHYHRGEFSKARKLCDDLLREARDAFIVVDARVCLWRASYALGDFEYCLTQYDVFRMYLSRLQHISPQRLQGYAQFAKGFVALIRIRLKFGDVQRGKRNLELQALATSLEKLPNSTNIRWLLLQIKETLAS